MDQPKKYPENATVVERMQWYVNSDQKQHARILAKVCDYLEECFLWEIEFEAE
jgi:hypothetical protein